MCDSSNVCMGVIVGVSTHCIRASLTVQLEEGGGY